MSQELSEHLEAEITVFLHRAHSISRQLSRDLHPDLEPSAYGLMLQVAREQNTRALDLATYLGVGKATIARQLAALEGLGLLTRSRDTRDHRSQVVTLTAAGATQVERVRTARQARVRDLLSAWASDDVELLAELLERFNWSSARGSIKSTGSDAETAETMS